MHSKSLFIPVCPLPGTTGECGQFQAVQEGHLRQMAQQFPIAAGRTHSSPWAAPVSCRPWFEAGLRRSAPTVART